MRVFACARHTLRGIADSHSRANTLVRYAFSEVPAFLGVAAAALKRRFSISAPLLPGGTVFTVHDTVAHRLTLSTRPAPPQAQFSVRDKTARYLRRGISVAHFLRLHLFLLR